MIVLYICLIWIIVGYIGGHVMYACETEKGTPQDIDWILLIAALWPIILSYYLLFDFPQVFFRKLLKKKKKKKEELESIAIPQLTKPKKRSAKCK